MCRSSMCMGGASAESAQAADRTHAFLRHAKNDGLNTLRDQSVVQQTDLSCARGSLLSNRHLRGLAIVNVRDSADRADDVLCLSLIEET